MIRCATRKREIVRRERKRREGGREEEKEEGGRGGEEGRESTLPSVDKDNEHYSSHAMEKKDARLEL